MSTPLRITDRTRLRRRPQRGSHERATVDAILDAAYVCHLAVVVEGAPRVLPTTYARIEDTLYLHGAAHNHALGVLAAGGEASIAVTLLDGLVLARTAFHHSVNYRSVVMFGRGRSVDDPDEKRRALAALLDHLVAGRSAACRPPDAAELGATRVVAFPIDEAVAKARSGPPLADTGADAGLPFWAGVIPLVTTRGAPIPAPDCTSER